MSLIVMSPERKMKVDYALQAKHSVWNISAHWKLPRSCKSFVKWFSAHHFVFLDRSRPWFLRYWKWRYQPPFLKPWHQWQSSRKNILLIDILDVLRQCKPLLIPPEEEYYIQSMTIITILAWCEILKSSLSCTTSKYLLSHRNSR